MLKKLTQKQSDFISDVVLGDTSRINILEGSVRSGKTFVSLIAWILMLVQYPEDSKFLMVGKTLTSLKRNCLVLLENLCSNGGFSFSISKKEAVLFGRKIYLEGVNDSRAENKIRGMTLQAAYCDELTLFTEDFFTMLLSRLSMPNAKLLATTNPDSPSHWLMKKYISRKDNLDLKIWKFLLDDNDTIPENIINSMKNEYTGVFYDRFILGKWVSAEGVIYTNFASKKDKYIVEKIPKYDIQNVFIGIDYGASKSKTAFVGVGITQGFKEVYVLKEKTMSGINSPEKLYESFFGFYEEIEKEYGAIMSCFADWGGLGQIQTKGLQNFFVLKNKFARIRDCVKHRIIERINLVCRLMGSCRFFVHESCKETIEALANAVWEENKEDVRLDNGTINIDVLDAMEYALSSSVISLTNSFNCPKKVDYLPVL